MFNLDANSPPRHDQAYSFCARWQKLAGYLLPPDVFTAAEALFSSMEADAGGKRRPPSANVRLAASLLRQALVFYPRSCILVF